MERDGRRPPLLPSRWPGLAVEGVGEFVPLPPQQPVLAARHPRIEVEVVAEDRFVDIVAEGYDAGVRLAEAIERDMSRLRTSLAERGLGLAYVFEPMVGRQLRDGRLQRVLDSYAATVPGFFLSYPSRAQRSPALRLFVEAARQFAVSPTAE